MPIPTPGPGVYLNSPSLTGVLGKVRDEVAAVCAELGADPAGAQATVRARLDALDATVAGIGGGTPATTILQVVADGTTDAAPTIQAALAAIGSSTKSRRFLVEGTTKGTIYLNSQIQITTSDTEVVFGAPLKFGTAIDPDGYGGLSILGTAGTSTTVTPGSGHVRGSSKISISSGFTLTPKTLVRIYDNDTGPAGSLDAAGNKSEMAEVLLNVAGLIYLDHPLHNTYTGTVTLVPITPVINSGYRGGNITFSGQQAAATRYPCKMQYTDRCFYDDMHLRGTTTDSWSREGFNVKWSYRSRYTNCTATMSWNYTISSTYSYGFSADSATAGVWLRCKTSNLRHGFSAARASAGLDYIGCRVENSLASGFDLHGGWCCDIRYLGCTATGSDTLNSGDTTHGGYIAGNTSYLAGAHHITYDSCTARGFRPMTPSGGGTGEGYGFNVVDGSSHIRYNNCTIDDCQMGYKVLSQVGVPITHVTISGGTISSMSTPSGVSLPVWVTAGVAPNDVDGLTVTGVTILDGGGMADMRIRGNSGNQLVNVRVMGNRWLGQGAAGAYPVDLRYVDNPVVTGNLFDRTRRGVAITSCPGAVITGNTMIGLTDAAGGDASRVIYDGGGNTNFVFAGNTLTGMTLTSWSTAITSSGASVTKPAAGVALV
jgi:hypothetical protein